VREQRAARMALRTIAPFAVLVPALALLVAWIVGRVVRPVQSFADALRARHPDDLTPVPVADLPDEVRPVAMSVNDLLARLRDALERERLFIAEAAHELRTPLTALSLQVQSLAATGIAAQQRSAVQSLQSGVARATRLVEQLLAVAREESSGVRERQPVQLDELARQTVADFVPLAEAAAIDLGIDRSLPVRVTGEEESLRTLLRNLLDNAIRYTPAGGRVDVGLSLRDGDRPVAELTVTDTGPGIPQDQRSRAFGRFHRLPGTTVTGSGLGLSLVEAVARRHGGEVALEDGPGGVGLRVAVRLPALLAC
jgi:two-component system OmpR family sensor kinase